MPHISGHYMQNIASISFKFSIHLSRSLSFISVFLQKISRSLMMTLTDFLVEIFLHSHILMYFHAFGIFFLHFVCFFIIKFS